jgi:uncharacterized membrane protein
MLPTNSLLGGAAVGAGAWISVLFSVPVPMLRRSSSQLLIIAFCTLSGLLGSLIDSFLGATLQYSGLDTKTGQIVEVSKIFLDYYIT